MEKKISVKGMSCQHCVGRVKKYLQTIENVSNVDVDLDKNEASFEFQGSLDLETIIKDIKDFGFQAREK